MLLCEQLFDTRQLVYVLLCHCSPIDDRERRLARKGPIWRTPMAFDVLRNLPFLRHVPQRAVEVAPNQTLPCLYRAWAWCLCPSLQGSVLMHMGLYAFLGSVHGCAPVAPLKSGSCRLTHPLLDLLLPKVCHVSAKLRPHQRL